MSYIKSTITNGEEIISEAKMSKWFFALDMFFGGLFFILGITAVLGGDATNPVSIFLLLIGVFLLVRAYIVYISTELAFTNKRVIAKVGFIKRDTVEMNITKVETIQVHQGILGRILNYGTIIISGAGNPQAPIKGIANPINFRNTFMEFTNKHI